MTARVFSDHCRSQPEQQLDIGEKAFAIHRPVQDEGRRQAVEAQARGEGRRLPMAMRHARPAALAARTAAPAARHLGVHPSLIDEDKPFGLQLQLVLEPGSALSQDIGALLLVGIRRLLTVMPCRSRSARRAGPGGLAVRRA
jgi:hypothetical protein